MKICAIICEFNPFHNGHKYLLDAVRRLSDCDFVLCIMSGSFTQRGDICITDKYKRAKHAVLCGADCVLELPSVFSVAPAEIFAKGAIKILSSIPSVTTLAFGCEGASERDFASAAEITENQTFKTELKQMLAGGESYIKSYACAFEKVGGNMNLVSNPNNILGLEYVKAIKACRPDIGILPINRVGSNHGDSELKSRYSSASAIRNNLSSPLIKDNVPDCVYADLKDFTEETERFKDSVRLILSRTSPKILEKIYGCGEGLNNKLAKISHLSYDEIIAEATSKRYPSSRIKRILLANFLKIYAADAESYLKSPLYLKPLAVKSDCSDAILSLLSKSAYPIVSKQQHKNLLSETALHCLECDEFAYKQWQIIARENTKDYMILV